MPDAPESARWKGTHGVGGSWLVEVEPVSDCGRSAATVDSKLRGGYESVAAQASELRECEIGITSFGGPDNWARGGGRER
jgi:hypothetical protein